ncbi:MAG: chorismate synthase [Bacteroidota bacterium]
MNTFGQQFRIHIFGESHGSMVGVQIDGCPAGIELSEEDFFTDIERRKSGAKGTTPRIEDDIPMLESGVFKGTTTGAPIMIRFRNSNTRSSDYQHLQETPRPGHADFTAQQKYGGYQDFRGGGHFSGRLTLGLVAAGVVAKKVAHMLTISAQLKKAGGSEDIKQAVYEALAQNDSVGGVVECTVRDIPIGLGEPFFNSAESLISHIIFAIPAIKGIEFGAGFQAAVMKGSEHNDVFIDEDGTTQTNHAGGINGGITNGNELVFRVAVKPTSSIGKKQQTLNMKTGEMTTLQVGGRHDACIALRVPVVVEAATAVALADMLLQAQKVPRIW